ncbi:steroid receptor RNA activator 1-like [Copidosoma floridanum]|uniref:steroid receptor RNA activator 1 n=1 Tax=Copidosoma floridanum TaxID=29053 RepID=UPI0006C947B0|nr:steroid receptor RNA activator 1 [Copidosoma floridanum]XP_014215553.1 steroid receptor RNA activator 1 [Copidosoma floridanum]XP_023247139.1 steroid receptor RNA activator 1-like [Copidosoma floridanum]
MEENSENAVSMQKKLPTSHDSGWNDPPAWALAAASQNSSTGTPKKRLMNKRVAFPLNSKPMEPAACPTKDQNMPPMVNMPPPVGVGSLTTAPHRPLVAPTKARDEDSDVEIDKEEALKDTLDNLCHAMEQLNSDRSGEIKKRIDRMETMWNEDKLNKVVHRKLLEVSKALREGEVEKADQLHVSLMMSNASVCSSWMPGIRQIITEMKSKKL